MARAAAQSRGSIGSGCLPPWGSCLASLPLLYAALFGLGVISALFGPVKYGILPDLLAKEELLAGNALVEAATFVAIFFGLIAGGLSVTGRTPAGTVLQLMAIAIACFAASLFIPATGRAAPGLRANVNVFASTWALLREIARDATLWRRSVAVSWFWMSGAVALSLVPVVIRNKTGGGIEVETAVSALFALGIGIGSLAAAVFANGRIYLRPVPFAALGMAAFLIDLGAATFFLPVATVEVGLADFFSSVAGLRVAFDVAGLACAGGLYVVPLVHRDPGRCAQGPARQNCRRREYFELRFHGFGRARDRRVAKPDASA